MTTNLMPADVMGRSIAFNPAANPIGGPPIGTWWEHRSPLFVMPQLNPLANVISVQLSSRRDVVGNEIGDLKAEVIWGSGGAQHIALVDLEKASSFSLTATSLTLNAVYTAATTAAIAATPPQYVLNASVTFGTIRGPGPTHTVIGPHPFLSIWIGAGLTSDPLPVPAFAARMRINSIAQSNGVYRIIFFDPTLVSAVSYEDALPGDWVDVPQSATYYTITYIPGNLLATDMVRPVFELAL